MRKLAKAVRRESRSRWYFHCDRDSINDNVRMRNLPFRANVGCDALNKSATPFYFIALRKDGSWAGDLD